MPAIETENEVIDTAKAEYLRYLDFGAGQFSLIGETIYRDIHTLFGYSPASANRIAHFVMREVGAMLAGEKFKLGDVKSGKVNKDGKVTVSFAAQKAKAITHGDALAILELVQWLNPPDKLGVNQSTIRCELSPKMIAVLDKQGRLPE